MAFDWRTFLTLAQILVKQESNDAALRSAISRAYYAAYIVARRHWETANGPVPREGSSHKIIWDGYANGSGNIERRIATDGNTMFTHRNRADYDDNIPGDLVSTAKTVLILAEKTIKNVEGLNASNN